VPVPNSLDEWDPSFVAATWPNPNTKNLVALGDSVAAGEGINYGFIWKNGKWVQTGPSSPSWMDTTQSLGANYPGCHQSGKGYPALLSLDDGNYHVYITCYTSTCDTPANTRRLNSQLALEKTDLATVLSQLDDWAAAKRKTLRVLVTNYYNPMNPKNDTCRDYQVALLLRVDDAPVASAGGERRLPPRRCGL